MRVNLLLVVIFTLLSACGVIKPGNKQETPKSEHKEPAHKNKQPTTEEDNSGADVEKNTKPGVIGKNEGYINWLHTHGVKGIFENAVAHNKQSAKNEYIFVSQQDAQNFKIQFLNDATKYGEVFLDKRLNKYVVPISENAQDHLKSLFFEKHSIKDLTDLDHQLELLKKARNKIQDFNKVEIQDATKIGRANYGKVGDRIARTAELLRNGDEDKGWYMHAAASAMDLLLSIYLATNYHLMSDDERKVVEKTQILILETDAKGRFVGGLKADANFVSYLLEQYSKNDKDSISARRKLIREDVNLLLNGGQRKIIDKKTPHQLKSIIANSNDPNSFRQKRFFPDENGMSEVDILVLQAGGMAGHSSMRTLTKVKDDSVPGKFRYFYTKIDAGAGAEDVDNKNWVGHGIFVTEIKPYFELTEPKNGVFVIAYNKNTGIPITLNAEGKAIIDADPALYRRHMFATIFALLDAERQILFYKSPQIAVSHGEGKGITEDEKFEWHYWNNKIITLRGMPVPEMHKITPLQQTGNCSVFSAMLTVLSLVGEDLGYDMLQTFKRYNQAITLKDIDVVEKQLLLQKKHLSP
jgi:hypothetical protein